MLGFSGAVGLKRPDFGGIYGPKPCICRRTDLGKFPVSVAAGKPNIIQPESPDPDMPCSAGPHAIVIALLRM